MPCSFENSNAVKQRSLFIMLTSIVTRSSIYKVRSPETLTLKFYCQAFDAGTVTNYANAVGLTRRRD